MNNDRLQELMTRSLSGEATATEWQELNALLAGDAQARARYQLLQQFWNHHATVSQASVEEALHRMLGQMNLAPTSIPLAPAAGKKHIHRYLWGSVAAAVVLMMLGGVYAYVKRQRNTGMASFTEKHNARGTKSTIELPDGSKIWLNADSRIRYPEVFAGNTREVYLNGEAFFDIAKNPGRPFIIHLANGTVRVLGTSFNIRAYDTEKIVETSVSTGKVAFIPLHHRNAKPDTVLITPDNKLRYLLEEEEWQVKPTVAAEDRAWTEGRLVFRGMTFADIAVELERNFGKQVTFLDEEAKTYKLTGSFQNNSLEEIMYYLSKTRNFHYKITNSELLITGEEGTLP